MRCGGCTAYFEVYIGYPAGGFELRLKSGEKAEIGFLTAYFEMNGLVEESVFQVVWLKAQINRYGALYSQMVSVTA